jgi:hypothetical protein
VTFLVARRFVFVLSAGLILALTGCGGSSNKGTIEGRWKFLGIEYPADTFLVFGDDGSVKLERPSQETLSDVKGNPPGWKYKLLAGDEADFYDLPADATARFGLFPAKNGVCRVTIVIETTPGSKYEDRTMTLADATGQTLKLSWVR